MRTLLLMLALLVPATAFADPEVGKPAPDFTAHSALGKDVHLADYKGKIVVLEWNNPQCPFVHKHYDSSNMQKLQQEAKNEGVVWLIINSSASGKEGYMNDKQAQEYMETNHIASAEYLLDPTGTVGHLYGARSTPHMFVIDAKGNIAYMGAIDDKPVADPKSLTAAHNYVRMALASLIKGEKLAVVTTQAYGCSVKYSN